MLIPLDGSPEAQRVPGMLEGKLSADAEVIMLTVIPPARSHTVGGQLVDASQAEETERDEALGYCRTVVDRIGGDLTYRCETTVSESVAEGIVEFAKTEDVDLIAMYTHGRKGLAKLIKGNIAADVRKRTTIDVEVFRPAELARV